MAKKKKPVKKAAPEPAGKRPARGGRAQKQASPSGSSGEHIQAYLFFDGRCDEALQFYRQALGAKVERVMRFRDCPDPAMCPPGSEERVMHAVFQVGTTQVMAADGRDCTGSPRFEGFALTLEVKTPAEAEKFFAALSAGGQVRMPLAKTFFAPSFGMVADRFGVTWMVLAGR